LWANQRFNILVVLEGPSDHTTALVFQDIAQIVRGGLQDLGHPARVVYCTNLVVDRCFVEGDRLIVLAPHNLASYSLDGRSAVLELQLLPPDAVLYNFEHVPGSSSSEVSKSSVATSGQRDKSLVSARTLEIYAHFTLWDYSEGNVDNLRKMGIRAELLPLGFSAELGVRNLYTGAIRREGGGGEDIDVLFIGMETPLRKATIERLRDAGIAVFHPNAAGRNLYGAEFDALSAKSKVMPRLTRLLANERFVISEMGGSPSERAQLAGGLVFVTSERLAETCKYYLEKPDLRRAIAERGRQVIEARIEADYLRGPV
ncbi:unnamed protein product, partial [Scytosiphon promiscuus]